MNAADLTIGDCFRLPGLAEVLDVTLVPGGRLVRFRLTLEAPRVAGLCFMLELTACVDDKRGQAEKVGIDRVVPPEEPDFEERLYAEWNGQ